MDYVWEERREASDPFLCDKSELILLFHYLREASQRPAAVKQSRDTRDFSVQRCPRGHVQLPHLHTGTC